MNDLLRKLLDSKKAMMAFNIQNIYQLSALHHLSVEKNIPVFAQFSAKYIPFLDKLHGLDCLINKYQNDSFLFHLDHCIDDALIKYCIDKGFASVMFDGSSLPIEENSRRTNLLYEYASQKNCLLEVELGAIKGVEDGFGADEGGYYNKNELVFFNEKSKFDMLALAIGNAHGFYTSTEEIKVEKLGEARELIGKVPFVLHGGTGMPDEMIYKAIELGVVKINVSTALKMEHFNITSCFMKNNKTYDEIKFYNFYLEHITPFFESFMLKYTI